MQQVYTSVVCSDDSKMCQGKKSKYVTYFDIHLNHTDNRMHIERAWVQ